MADQTPVWFITATSSGFGHALALAALKQGHTVIATARNPESIQDLADCGAHTLAFDVVSPYSTIEALAKDLFAKYGRIDYLINAAGYLLLGAVEEVSQQEIYDSFNVNVFGALNTIRAFLPHMRTQAIAANGVRATIVTFGSLGSWKPHAGCAIYCMNKACASLLAENLNDEIAPFAMRAVVVEPGHFRTAFLKSNAMVKAKVQLGAYNGDDTASGQIKQILAAVDGKQIGDPDKGAQIILDVLTGSGVAKGRALPVRIVLGSDCQQTIKEKCTNELKMLEEWADVASSTDFIQDG